ncbi:hypothetical protein UFOVP26_25 [uncultured Caudovirales phage]|uniref:Uncharacterized protein n=1 Tax=uncultured Caudovirales phage TaxID=2100421 RepID=A0A6J5KNK5_9CAUD|nr:hypothetical protein UFOVP26_25 [uncultured Caudovirales phage]CAB4123868.1 hypothetical protein UFOVP44_72 [uncultured Caudovirales phage]CAB5219313.1 hypothetical protein UFOVP220_63 [uncultured Caudovirales phage]
MSDSLPESKCQFTCGKHISCERYANPNQPREGVTFWFVRPPIRDAGGRCPAYKEKQ